MDRASIPSRRDLWLPILRSNDRTRQSGLNPSMGSVVDCFGNAVTESFSARVHSNS